MHLKTRQKKMNKRWKRMKKVFDEFAHRGIKIIVPVKRVMYSFKGGHVFVSNYLDIKRDYNQNKAFYMMKRR